MSGTETKTRARRAKMTIDTAAQTVTFAVWGPDGKTLAPASADTLFVANYRSLPDDIKLRLGLDRLRNKLMDSYSDAGKTGIPILTSARETYDGLAAGMWEIAGEAGVRLGHFVEAYARHFKKPIEDARKVVNDVAQGDDVEKKARLAGMRAHPTFVALMAAIAQEKAAERAKLTADAAKGAKLEPLAAF